MVLKGRHLSAKPAEPLTLVTVYGHGVARFTAIHGANETKNSRQQRKDHQTVEMPRPGEAVNDERVPGVPNRVGEMRRTADQP